MHIVIAGNGILALTTAFRLVQELTDRDRISIIGSSSRPGSATLAAAAMLSTFAEVEADLLDSEVGLYHFELIHLASQMWPRLLQEIIARAGPQLPSACSTCAGPCGGCYDQGTYLINDGAAPERDEANFNAIVAALAQCGEAHQVISGKEIPHYAPQERHRATRALFLPNEGWVNPRLILASLEGALARAPQVRFVEGTVERLEARNARMESVVLEDGLRLEGDRFLLATGASVTDVLTQSGLDLPVQRVFYGQGVSLELRSTQIPRPSCIRTPNRSPAGLYSVPYFTGPAASEGHILVGATHAISATPAPYPSLAAVESLIRRTTEQLHEHLWHAELLRVNHGWRPTSQDTFPLIGATSIPNLVLATGTRRDGFHLSPLLSTHIARALLGQPPDDRFLRFAPERRLIRHLRRDRAIAAAVQRGLDATSLECLHDQVGAQDWGIPPEMVEMYRHGHARAPA
jgi:glycine/D-amino acid oxidase-like deaminating enzyme